MAFQTIVHAIVDFGPDNPDHPVRYALRYSQGEAPLDPTVWTGSEISVDDPREFLSIVQTAEQAVQGEVGLGLALAQYIKDDPNFLDLSASQNRSFVVDLSAPSRSLSLETVMPATNPAYADVPSLPLEVDVLPGRAV